MSELKIYTAKFTIEITVCNLSEGYNPVINTIYDLAYLKKDKSKAVIGVQLKYDVINSELFEQNYLQTTSTGNYIVERENGKLNVEDVYKTGLKSIENLTLFLNKNHTNLGQQEIPLLPFPPLSDEDYHSIQAHLEKSYPSV